MGSPLFFPHLLCSQVRHLNVVQSDSTELMQKVLLVQGSYKTLQYEPTVSLFFKDHALIVGLD